jgi:putative phosphoribosyl transferase
MPDITGRTVILVDDGIATGATIYLAVELLQKHNPEKIIVAVPVASPETVMQLEKTADEVIALLEPLEFKAVGEFYREFTQVESDEVRRMLESDA